MLARDIMTANPYTVTPTDTVERATQLMRTHKITSIPVVDHPSTRILRGVITERDIVHRCAAKGHGTSCYVYNHMSTMPLATVYADADESVVTEKMSQTHVHAIPVIARSGMLKGIITPTDLERKFVGAALPGSVQMLSGYAHRRNQQSTTA